MRFIAVALCLLCIPLVCATSYTVYNDKGVELPEGNFSFKLVTRGDADYYSALSAYTSAKKSNVTSLIDATYNASLDALYDAKSDDALYITTPWKTEYLNYKDCKRIDKYEVCFDSVTYLEEDSTPLGDGRLDTVKVVDGETFLPSVVTITEAKVELEVSRTLSPSSVYPGEPVKVTLSVVNKGIEDAKLVTIVDSPPFRASSGKISSSKTTLAQFEQLLLVYEVEPDVPGYFNFTGEVSSEDGFVALADSTLTVNNPLTFIWGAPDVYVGEDSIITLNITNTFDEEVTLTDLSFSSGETFVATPGGYNPRTSFPGAVLAVGGTYSTSVTYRGSSAGEKLIEASLTYETKDDVRYIDSSDSYLRKTPSLVLNPLFNGRVVSLEILNDGPSALDGVVIIFSDGFTKSLARLKSEAQIKVDHTFNVTSDTPAWVYLSHPAQDGRVAFAQNFSGVIITSALDAAVPSVGAPPLAQAPSLAPDSAAAPAAPIVPSEGVVSASNAQPASRKGVLSRIIDSFISFLDGLFS